MFKERELKEKIVELRRTIQFLCNTMTNAADEIDNCPVAVRMILREAVDDKRYEYR